MRFIAWLYFFVECLTLRTILQFGGIKGTDTLAAQQANKKAIFDGLNAVNKTQNDRAFKIPAGTFYSMPIVLDDLHNLTIIIEGKLSASKSVKNWPNKSGSLAKEDFLFFRNSSLIEIRGGGKIDGRGYHWWIIEWLQLKKVMPAGSKRPHLILIQDSKNFSIHDLTLKNSPSFHLKIDHSFYFEIYNLNIKVNTTAQLNLMKQFSLEGVLPTFPLNTDGIDPNGQFFHIYNLTVQNYDDVVVPKPSHEGSGCDCTQHMLIQNVSVRLGVGLSVGSVSPNVAHSCVRNILFRNAEFSYPFKGIYLKTNPGSVGSGEITNITYQNMELTKPIWWAVYLGPQQQKQPDGGGPGCMLYPFDPKGTCQTQPLIDITNITLKNITIHESLLFPIVLRCNQTNPCPQITFERVRADDWIIGAKNRGFVCENVKGRQEGGYPRIDCLTETSQQPSQLAYSKEQKVNFVKEVWRRLEEASKANPYEEEDDQMDLDMIELTEQ